MFTITQVEAMERLCRKFMRRWQGVPPTFSLINLYSKTSNLCLPVTTVVEEFKATKVRAVSTLLLCEDEKVRHLNKTIKRGRRYRPQEAVTEADAYWKHQEIVNVICQGQLDLGQYNDQRWSKASAKGRRALVVQRVREVAEEDCSVKAVGLVC